MRSVEIRTAFIDYFRERGHTVVPSASLVPAGDPTLLFVNAGMVPFKDVFLGRERRSYSRATSVQKCLRVSGKHNDLEEVGPSAQHQTFFEMLGNFSFGDYFKREAIEFAWDFLTHVLGLTPDKLRPTVFEEDPESAALWPEVSGLPPERIVPLGADDNFWAMGDTGPCGPNSEIIYDRTGACLRDGSDCRLTCDCGRWWEIWNLVFMQFDRAQDGTLTPLERPGVDTGMGFERITAVLQGVPSNYETDLFTPLIDRLRELTGESQIADERLPAYRAVADHARAMTFLIADGVMPSNEGRGYVLRRILRRASYQGNLIGLGWPFLAEVCRRVIDVMGGAYPETAESRARILELVTDEEQRFLDTLASGLTRLERAIEERREGGNVLAGEEAFRLYDTYGFPIDLTRKVLERRGWAVDERGFEQALEAQRQRARAARSEGGRDEALLAAVRDLDPTRFVGYDALDADANVLAVVAAGAPIDAAEEGTEVDVVLDVSPFYAEGGGQVGDAGSILTSSGEVRVETVRRVGHGVFAHSGRVVTGRVVAGQEARAVVDEAHRRGVMRNHTATHLLHRALRIVLGPQAKQAGSLVAPDRLRFDFFHNKPLTEDELRETERLVREQVLHNRAVHADVMPLQAALALGADAMFDEKYAEDARVVSINGGDVFSRELCGGTHCHAAGEIGAFFITEQRSVGAGVRRVEAVTGAEAFAWADARRRVAEELAREYNVPLDELPARIRELQERAKASAAGGRAAASDLPDPAVILASAEQRNGTLLIVDRIDAADADALRSFGDELRRRVKSAAIVLGAVFDGKPAVVVMLTADQVQGGLHAGKLAKEIGASMGAGGGGKPDVATAGGRDAAQLDAALSKARELLGA